MFFRDFQSDDKEKKSLKNLFLLVNVAKMIKYHA